MPVTLHLFKPGADLKGEPTSSTKAHEAPKVDSLFNLLGVNYLVKSVEETAAIELGCPVYRVVLEKQAAKLPEQYREPEPPEAAPTPAAVTPEPPAEPPPATSPTPEPVEGATPAS